MHGATPDCPVTIRSGARLSDSSRVWTHGSSSIFHLSAPGPRRIGRWQTLARIKIRPTTWPVSCFLYDD